MLTLDSIPNLAPDAVTTTIADNGPAEMILVLPGAGKIKVLNEAGGFIVSQIDGRRNVRRLAGLLAETYEVSAAEAETDTLQFLSELAAAGGVTW